MIKKFLIFLSTFVLYIIIGMLLPFYNPKSVSSDYSDAINPQAFYGSAAGPDRAAVIESNQDALDVRLAMIEDAREEIIITTFDIRSGDSTTDLFSALYAAAGRGVTVRIIVDGMSGLVHMSTEPLFYVIGSHPNIHIKYYNPPNPLQPWTINGRMHDKYMIVDQTILLAGGRNLFDYFLGTHPDKPSGQDREVLIYRTGTTGSCIEAVTPYFNDMWNSSACRPMLKSVPWYFRKKAADLAESLSEHYASLEIPGWDYEQMTAATGKISFITNPAHIFGKEPYVWEQLYCLMKESGEEVLIHTPYLVCSQEMYQGFGDLAGSLPKIRILVNSIASGDNLCASSDYLRNRQKILDTGVILQEYMGSSSTHGKSLTVGDDIAVIGSYNFDNRSTYVDTETMFVIHSPEINRDLKQKITLLTDDALTVGPDGQYLDQDGIVPSRQPKGKNLLIKVLSFLIQPFRYLI